MQKSPSTYRLILAAEWRWTPSSAESGTRSIAATPVAGGHSYADKGFPTKETGIGAGAGAVLGGIIGGKKGAAIGAAAGGAGGAAMGAARDDYEVALNSGSDLTVRTTSSISL